MLDAGSSLCKPLGEIAVDEIWIKLHLTKVSLVQSVKYHTRHTSSYMQTSQTSIVSQPLGLDNYILVN